MEDNEEAIISKPFFMSVQEETKRIVNIRSGMNVKKLVYGSKYVLSSLVFYGHCNDMHCRIHWNIHVRKQIVWRYVTRLNAPRVKYQARTLTEA